MVATIVVVKAVVVVEVVVWVAVIGNSVAIEELLVVWVIVVGILVEELNSVLEGSTVVVELAPVVEEVISIVVVEFDVSSTQLVEMNAKTIIM